MHIERILLLNQTSCEIPLEVSHNNSLRQGSYSTTNHPVILGNVCDPFFEILLMPNQDQRRLSHVIWPRTVVVTLWLMYLWTHRSSVAGILQFPDLLHHQKYSLFIHIKFLLVNWKTLHCTDSYCTFYRSYPSMCLTSKNCPCSCLATQAGHILMLIILSIKTFSEQYIELFAVFAVALSSSFMSIFF